jgi:NAD(P)-dependent dehydrogenase (short-subunit alcohol dehydrogenase family)
MNHRPPTVLESTTMIDQTVTTFGRLDMALNNAGI